MRRFLGWAAMSLMLATPAMAETLHVGVDGLVCAFCAAGLKKSFGKEANVASVDVDLEQKLVTIATRSGQTLDDATVTRIITDAGYKVTNIHHQE